MGIIANIEKELMDITDFDKIIPKSWILGKVPFLNRENWWLIIALFFAIIIALHVVLFSGLTVEEKSKQILLDVFGMIFVGIYWSYLDGQHKRFIKKAKGKDIK